MPLLSIKRQKRDDAVNYKTFLFPRLRAREIIACGALVESCESLSLSFFIGSESLHSNSKYEETSVITMPCTGPLLLYIGLSIFRNV